MEQSAETPPQRAVADYSELWKGRLFEGLIFGVGAFGFFGFVAGAIMLSVPTAIVAFLMMASSVGFFYFKS